MDYQVIAQLLGNYGEFVGAIAVVITLAYLSVQIRQNANAVKGSTEMEARSQFADWYARTTSDRHLQLLYEQGAVNEVMKPEDARTFIWMQAEFVCLCEGWFHQYRRGLMSGDSWEPLADGMVGVLQNRYMREWWDAGSAPLTREFVSYINERGGQEQGDWRLVRTGEIIERAERSG